MVVHYPRTVWQNSYAEHKKKDWGFTFYQCLLLTRNQCFAFSFKTMKLLENKTLCRVTALYIERPLVSQFSIVTLHSMYPFHRMGTGWRSR